MADFYGRELGIDVAATGAERLSLAIGETAIEFVAGSGEPFYHFALLVPGDRFDEALGWASERTELLPDPDSGEVVFDFENWDACACYFPESSGTRLRWPPSLPINSPSHSGTARWTCRDGWRSWVRGGAR